MKSVISSAVLCAASLSQLASAATIGHSHGHVHRRASAPVAKRNVQFMSTTDIDSLDSKKILTGKNVACADKAQENNDYITVGDDGPFVVEFNNQSPDDIVVVVWSGAGQGGAVGASFIGTIGGQQPDVTHTLKSNTTTTVSFDPSDAPGNALSGAWGAIYPNTGLTSFSGQLDNVWGEYTFTTANNFSTTDVSRLVNMAGNPMEIHNYASKDDADDDDVLPACVANNENKAFVCDAGDHCMAGKIIGCTEGEENTVCNASGMDGGCAGIPSTGGYVKVKFS